jgi:hypothetical protein
MNRNRIITFFVFTLVIIALTSCGITSHPNEKLIVGKWRPVKVEKIVDSSALQAGASMKGTPGKKQTRPGSPAGEGGAARKEAIFDRFIQSEMQATMEIFANKTAIKNYPGKPLNVTWKMKGKGTRIIAKNVGNKTTIVIDILAIDKERIVVMEHTRGGDVKISYERQF